MDVIRCENNWGGFSDIPKEKLFFRPSVYGLIVNQKNEIVLVTNKSNGKFWFPGGGIEIDEKIEDALKREIKEETGLEVEIIKQLLLKDNFFYYEPEDLAFHAFLIFFLCKPINNTGLITDELVDDGEAEKPRWIDLASLKQENFCSIADDCWKMIQTIKTGL